MNGQTTPSSTRALAVLATGLLLLGACAPGPSGDTYEAQIRRTSHGIPHITAADIGSLGFGEGYAQAEDHLCSVADQVVRARGERSKYFGPGDDDRHLRSDVTMKALDVHERAASDFQAMADDVKQWYQGYVDGYNLYLEETGVDNVAGWCSGQDWVFPITTSDLAAYHRVVTITSTRFADQIATAQPPGGGPVTSASIELTEPETASNGWALGSERSASGRGMLIANPHYPWIGSNRFWEKHITIPGELDAYGVGLIGIPGVAIGFNDAVAWTHTVSAGDRFTLYSLQLVEGNATRYRYGDEERDMTAELVSVEVKQDDGSLASHEQQVWFSHYGPVLNFPNVGWSENLTLTMRDANEDNDEGRQQWLAMDRAKSLDEFKQAHADYQECLGSTRSRRAPKVSRGTSTRHRHPTSPKRPSPRGTSVARPTRSPWRWTSAASCCSTAAIRPMNGSTTVTLAILASSRSKTCRSSSGATTSSTPMTATGSPTPTSWSPATARCMAASRRRARCARA